jgi:hypothetical protein
LARLVALVGSGLTWTVVGGLVWLGVPIWSEKPPEVLGVSLGQLFVATAAAVAVGWLLVVGGLLADRSRGDRQRA